MNLSRNFAISALATLAISFTAACGQSEDVAAAAQSITIADAYGSARSVTVLETDTTESGGYAKVLMAGRSFTLSQWVDGGARHSVVTSGDSALRYEYIADASGAKLVLNDAAGERVVKQGDSMGKIDEDAASLLLNFRQADVEGEATSYTYQTVCVGYDTSDPADWHLTVGSCTCAHWYSVICTGN